MKDRGGCRRDQGVTREDRAGNEHTCAMAAVIASVRWSRRWRSLGYSDAGAQRGLIVAMTAALCRARSSASAMSCRVPWAADSRCKGRVRHVGRGRRSNERHCRLFSCINRVGVGAAAAGYVRAFRPAQSRTAVVLGSVGPPSPRLGTARIAPRGRKKVTHAAQLVARNRAQVRALVLASPGQS